MNIAAHALGAPMGNSLIVWCCCCFFVARPTYPRSRRRSDGVGGCLVANLGPLGVNYGDSFLKCRRKDLHCFVDNLAVYCRLPKAYF